MIQQPITQSANLQVYALQHRHLHLANSSNSASKPNYLWTIDLRFFGLKNGMHHERIHYTLDDTIAAGLVHALLLGDNLFQCREPGFELGHDDVLRLAELGVKGRAVRAGGHGQLSSQPVLPVLECCLIAASLAVDASSDLLFSSVIWRFTIMAYWWRACLPASRRQPRFATPAPLPLLLPAHHGSVRALPTITKKQRVLSTYRKHRPDQHAMVRLQAVFIPLSKRHTQLFLGIVQVDTQAARGEFQSAQEPLETDGGSAVAGFGHRGLFVREELFESLGGGGVAG